MPSLCVYKDSMKVRDDSYKGVAYTNHSGLYKIIPKYSTAATLKLQYNSMVVRP